MNREANLIHHIKNLNEKMHDVENKIMDKDSLTADDIVKLRLEQLEYQTCIIWLNNILKSKFPKQILHNGNGDLKILP